LTLPMGLNTVYRYCATCDDGAIRLQADTRHKLQTALP